MDAYVMLWGREVGALSLKDGDATATFQYSPSAIRDGLGISPLRMPLARRVYRFPALPRDTFKGVPGVFADSLPDRFGNVVIDAWLRGQGRAPGSMSAVERLLYTGKRGMGALEYEPALMRDLSVSEKVAIDEIASLANRILSEREGAAADLSKNRKDEELLKIARVGTSAGGARAKALIAINRNTGEVRSGQVQAPEGFEYCLIKFDGVSGNGDHGFLDPLGYTNIEYAYHLLARHFGIEMSECWLLKEGGRSHFVTKRFDRSDNGDKLHMVSLGGLCHYDFNTPGCAGYEDAALALEELCPSAWGREQIYRRMVFNVVFRNLDDHVKNFAFLMDREGEWRLAPAFDLTFSYNPDSRWTRSHQMTINGRTDEFSAEDFKEAARTMKLPNGKWRDILHEARGASAFWMEAAAEAGVPEETASAIAGQFRRFGD